MIRGVPYDAEVEYLESTGTQWIDTGVVPSESTRWELDYQVLSPSGIRLCGMYSTTGGAKRFCVGVDTSNGVVLSYGGNFVIAGVTGDLLKHHYVIDAASLTWAYDSTTGIYRSSVNGFGSRIFLFCRANTGNLSEGKHSGRVFASKIYQDGVLVRDFIPVRVGTVGYLYDRVTRRLFGNQGTGAFLYGPDVATPVMGLWRFRDITTTGGNQ